MSQRHFQTLLSRAARIQFSIEREQSRNPPDRLRLLKLKTVQMALRERLERLVMPAAPAPVYAPVRPQVARR